MSTDTATQTFISTDEPANSTEFGFQEPAREQAGNVAIAELAQWIGQDDSVLGVGIAAAAHAVGGTSDGTPTAAEQAVIASLSPLHGAAFDQAYLADDLAAETANLASHEAYLAAGTQPPVLQEARADLPLLEDHLHELQLFNQAYEGGPAPVTAFAGGYLATPPLAAEGPLDASDKTFLGVAANFALLAAAEGVLALSRGGSQSVDVLGAWNVTTGGQLIADIMPLAAAGGAALPSSVDAAGAAQIADLQGLTGQAFDVQFARDQMTNDQVVTSLQPAEDVGGSDPALVERSNILGMTASVLLQQAIIEYTEARAGLTDASAAPTTFAGALLNRIIINSGDPIADADGSSTPPAATSSISGLQFVNASTVVAANYGGVVDAAATPVTVNGTGDFGTENPGYDQIVDVLGSTAGFTYYAAADGYADIALTGGNNLVLSGLGSADGGADTISAQGGDNTIYAGNGDDFIETSGGRNLIGLGEGSNVVVTGADDTVVGSSGSDTIFATGGASQDFAGSKGLTFVAGSAPALGAIYTSAGSAVVYGGSGSALTLVGAAHGDIIVAGAGAETLNGAGLTGGGTFFAGSGADQITGGPASTAFVLGSGNASVAAGAGANLFQFIAGLAGGSDQIAFNASDVIALTGYAAGTAQQLLTSQTHGAGTVSFVLPDLTRVTLSGISSLSASNFV